MAKDDSKLELSRRPNPGRFLLADEYSEEYEDQFERLLKDLKPVGALEYRQVELILRCDIDIERQYRFIAEHLNPLKEDDNKAAQVFADWHKQALMHQNALDDLDDADPPPDAAILSDGDARLTPLVASRYAKMRYLMDTHQREIVSAQRRRRQEIAMLADMQERRRRREVPDTVPIDPDD